MKYPCLVLDHDDTVVNSTATIHFPAFVAFMEEARPNIHMTLDEFFAYNFHPGVVPLFQDICGLNDEEKQVEEEFWSKYVKTRIPPAFDGIREILVRHKEKGGFVCVISHSFSHYILRDYRENQLPEPDLIFGWEFPPEQRKPSPYALYEIEKQYDLRPDEILVLDDLKPGLDMARSAGVSFAAAGWSNDVPQIENYMRKNSDYYFKTVREFASFLDE